ncbi:MAG: Gfo/Idh/MocA family oxidoreductase, partial [Planctomycetes bacterium]|nr:Gfo/Idh/MocA family oxidoreductase [Planctomycetota bacterium]
MKAINDPLNRKLRMALIGGGGQAFIGPVHFAAATLDHRAELVAGALSSDPQRSRDAAAAFGIAPERAYDSYRDLFERETQLPADVRIDFVSIATPNHTHYEIARAALDAGFHVVCDKPMTIDVDQAEQLAALTAKTGAVFGVTYCYSGYPMVRQARDMVRGGDLGEIQAVRVTYIQGGLWRVQPGQTPARAAW